MKAKIKKIGNSHFVLIPKWFLVKINKKEGDVIEVDIEGEHDNEKIILNDDVLKRVEELERLAGGNYG